MQGFREIWVVDFEYIGGPGERPVPVCLVAQEVRSGRSVRYWEDEWHTASSAQAPYPLDNQALFVAYYAPAEMRCHLALRWGLPAYVLDLYAEFRVATNGRPLPAGRGLLGALSYFGLDGMQASRKDDMRSRILRGPPYSAEERIAILDYCEADVDATRALLHAMAGDIDWPRAFLRGRYCKAVAQMEATGIPVDTGLLAQLQEGWPSIQRALITEIDVAYEAFEQGSFRASRWSDYLAREGIPWPRHASGSLALDQDTFKERALAFPQIEPMRQLRNTLAQMRRLELLAVGKDGRNRCMLSAFSSKTGRNQPSNSAYIFGRPKWLRALIRPDPGFGLAYIDWEQQEFGIAAALSEDENMQRAYLSGDPYLAFAQLVGAVPRGATKESHPREREQFKACVLAVQYGMGAESLARRISQPVARARELLEMHRRAFRRYWEWNDGAVCHGLLNGTLSTAFGWPLWVSGDASVRTLQNFPMQANGAEMLRLACCSATEAGVAVCGPVHDAILIEAPLAELGIAIETAVSAGVKMTHLVG